MQTIQPKSTNTFDLSAVRNHSTDANYGHVTAVVGVSKPVGGGGGGGGADHPVYMNGTYAGRDDLSEYTFRPITVPASLLVSGVDLSNVVITSNIPIIVTEARIGVVYYEPEATDVFTYSNNFFINAPSKISFKGNKYTTGVRFRYDGTGKTYDLQADSGSLVVSGDFATGDLTVPAGALVLGKNSYTRWGLNHEKVQMSGSDKVSAAEASRYPTKAIGLTVDENSKDKPITLKWTTKPQQVKYQIKYKPKGLAEIVLAVVDSTEQSYVFPINTFPVGETVVSLVVSDGFYWSDWTNVSINTHPNEVTTFKPNTPQDQDKPIIVSWDNLDTQAKFELETTSISGTKLITGTTAKTHTFPVNSFYFETVTMRIRTYNGYVWSPWKDGSFETTGIAYPNNLEPNSIAQNKDVPIKLSWVARFQTSYELQYTSDGVTTTKTGTTGKSITIPANTLATGRVNWKLRINTSLLLTDWVEASFTAFGTPETPVLTTVAQYETATPIFTWTSNGQVSYRIQVLKDEIVVLDSSDVYSNAKQHVFQTALENNTNYTVRVRINNQYEYSSAWSTKAFKVVFTDLQKPSFDMFPDDREGKVLFNIYNAKGQSEFKYCELLRREYEETEWQKVATNLGETSMYTDYTCRSGVLYEYKVSAIKTTGGYTDSEIALNTVSLKNTMLSDTGDYDNYVLLTHNPKKSRTLNKETHIMQYNGSPTPRIEFGDIVYQGVSVNFTVDEATLDKLSDLYYSNNTLLFRDNRGKKLFGVISGEITVEDADFMKYSISFNFIETIFKEGVPA